MYDCVGAEYFNKDCIFQYKYLNECIIQEEMCGNYKFTTQIPIFLLFLLFLNNFIFSIDLDHEDIAKLEKCYVQGRIYSENEKFSIDGHECLCTKHFDNTTLISENSSCAKISFCGIESISRMINGIRKGCVPVFQHLNRCPIEYKCRKSYYKLNCFFFKT